MDTEKIQYARAIARDLRRCASDSAGDCDHCAHRDRLIDCGARLKTDAAAVIDAMAAELESSAEQPAPNTAVRLELLNEIINLTSFHLNRDRQSIMQSLIDEAAQGITYDDPTTVALSRELLSSARKPTGANLPDRVYRATVRALVPVTCPRLETETRQEERMKQK